MHRILQGGGRSQEKEVRNTAHDSQLHRNEQLCFLNSFSRIKKIEEEGYPEEIPLSPYVEIDGEQVERRALTTEDKSEVLTYGTVNK